MGASEVDKVGGLYDLVQQCLVLQLQVLKLHVCSIYMLQCKREIALVSINFGFAEYQCIIILWSVKYFDCNNMLNMRLMDIYHLVEWAFPTDVHCASLSTTTIVYICR